MTNKFDKSDEKLREQYEEAFFQELMEGYDEYQGSKMKREDNYEEKPSPELLAQIEVKIAREINRQKKIKVVKKLHDVGKYVAIFFVAIVIVFSISFVTVDAFRNKILNYFSEDQGESTVHTIQQEQSGKFLPSYIPENMDIVLYSDDVDPVEIILQSNDATYYASIFIYDGRTKVHSDTEDALVFEYVLINSVQGEYCEKDGRASLTWYNIEGSHIAQMNANIEKDDMLRIARSILL